MPVAYVKKLAKKKGVSIAKSEKRWGKAKEIASDSGESGNYAYVMGIYKRMMGEEEVPVNNAGDGKVAGIGVGSGGEPGAPPKRKLRQIIGKGRDVWRRRGPPQVRG